MLMTRPSFTYEDLKSLKFKELQKLSMNFCVNKRWAKKQELIENLLALNEKHETINKKQEDEHKWRDASTVFNDLKVNNEIEENKRLTYNVNAKSDAEHTDSHLAFEVIQNDKNLLETFSSRETYDIPPNMTNLGCEFLKESRATFEIPPKKKLLNETHSTITLDNCESEEKLLEESAATFNKSSSDGNLGRKNLKHSEINLKQTDDSQFKADLRNIKFKGHLKNGKQENDEEKNPEVKMLTIPYARVTRRTRAGEAFRNDSSPIRMSKKSINIKKSTRLPVSKTNLIKSPAFSSVKKSINKQTIIQSLTKNQPGGPVRNKVPIRLQFTEEKFKAVDDGNKENVEKIPRRQIVDEAVNKKQNPAVVSFRTPPTAIKNSRISALKKNLLKKPTNGRLNSSAGHTPGGKAGTKPITMTKMPDFSKIHKKQFDQMDSLHDYLKKKGERIRKLFGTPQPGQQLHNLNKSTPVFHFQSAKPENENKGRGSLKCATTTPLKKKENESILTQKEAFKSKLPPSKLRADITDKNRSHIHGVRTNKRFELQMKFRNP